MESVKDPTTIDEALDLYWVDRSVAGHVPNYTGFQKWVTTRIESMRARAPLPLHAREPSYRDFPQELLEAARAGGVRITSDGATPDPDRFAKWNGKQSRLRRVNKSKLLLSYFEHASPRWREALLALSKANLSVNSLARNSSQAEHRVAFFHAVASGDGHKAFKMVGRLREEAHDPGEIAYLEATASFHSNRFSEAIEFARDVPADAIDWPQAFLLSLEAHAYLGDFSSIEREVGAHPEFAFPEYFIQYICQVTIENSTVPKDAVQAAGRILETILDLSQAGPGAFQMWNRHSCRLAVQVVEQLRDANLTDEALRQTAGVGEPLQDLEDSLSFQRIGLAFALDGDLAERLSAATNDDAYVEIVKRLMNFGSPGHEEYFQALATQWRIGDRSVFLNNVLSSLDAFPTDRSPEVRQALLWAYQQAKGSHRAADAERIRTKLADAAGLTDVIQQMEAASANDRFQRALSPMGRLAWRSANWDLDQAEKDSLLWRDAGMISLGFFRIIELEFNERLILPALQDLDIDRLEATLDELKTGELNKSKKEAIANWERMLPQLRRSQQSGKGLELGAIEMLLAKTAKLTGPDGGLKAPIHSQLIRRLTRTGAEAFHSGKLRTLFDGAARERFRNPPAHSRYVTLAVARECKQHVENVLQRLIEFTLGRNSVPTTN